MYTDSAKTKWKKNKKQQLEKDGRRKKRGKREGREAGVEECGKSETFRDILKKI